MKPVVRILFFVIITASFQGCSKKNVPEEPDDIWDIDTKGIPEFVNTNYIELSKIYRISKFRSSIGHDYSDSYESCRSMKHYFEPLNDLDWTTVKIFAPVSGKITRVEQEWAGTKLEIQSTGYPAFRFQVFHITTAKQYSVDMMVSEGEQLGTHSSGDTYSDISVIVNDPSKQGIMVSWFNVLTDDAFSEYTQYGLSSRDDVIISKSARDASPLTCSGDSFTSADPLECWFYLN